MKFIYAPEDDTQQRWEVEVSMDRPRLTAGEGVFLERHHDGKPLSEIFEAASSGSTTAMLSILFVFRKRDEPTLRYGDFEDSIVLDDLEVELEATEEPDAAAPKDDPSPEGVEPPVGAESGTSPTTS